MGAETLSSSTPNNISPQPETEESTHLTGWENSPFGSLSGSEPIRLDTSPTEVFTPEIFIATEKVTEPTKRAKKEKTPHETMQERREGITEAVFEVRLDKEAIANILTDNPQFIPKTDIYFGSKKERDKEWQERYDDLQRTLDAIASLPEVLRFEPGITLIVGENGLGKSTLAHALKLAEEVKDSQERDFFAGMTHAEVLEKQIDKGMGGGGPADKSLNSLAPHVAKFIQVDELKRFGPIDYTDASLMMGYRNQQTQDYNYQRGKRWELKDTDLSMGGSHRQTVDKDVFNGYAMRKEEYLTSPRGKEGELLDGPRIYYVDEPEVGMSPRRHRGIEKQIEDIMIPNSIAIIPTNSIVLYESDLPRIDLEHPERGIFRPSEYPEDRA